MSEAQLSGQLQQQLIVVCKAMGFGFTFKSRPLTMEEVFSEEGLLPGLAKRADQLASLCLGYRLGASYEPAEKTLLNSRVSFDQFTPDFLRLCCIIDSVTDIAAHSQSKEAVSLDELMYD